MYEERNYYVDTKLLLSTFCVSWLLSILSAPEDEYMDSNSKESMYWLHELAISVPRQVVYIHVLSLISSAEVLEVLRTLQKGCRLADDIFTFNFNEYF